MTTRRRRDQSRIRSTPFAPIFEPPESPSRCCSSTMDTRAPAPTGPASWRWNRPSRTDMLMRYTWPASIAWHATSCSRKRFSAAGTASGLASAQNANPISAKRSDPGAYPPSAQGDLPIRTRRHHRPHGPRPPGPRPPRLLGRRQRARWIPARRSPTKTRRRSRALRSDQTDRLGRHQRRKTGPHRLRPQRARRARARTQQDLGAGLRRAHAPQPRLPRRGPL